MSVRIVWKCDICGKEVEQKREIYEDEYEHGASVVLRKPVLWIEMSGKLVCSGKCYDLAFHIGDTSR